MTAARSFGWFQIFRIGLVQASLGAVIVLTTSTLNRVMVVELALPALLPGALVALHYFVQISRPSFGHGSDVGGRRVPWIVGGMAVLALGGLLASLATALLSVSTAGGIALASVAFLLIGAGVGACGTSLLVLLADRVEPQRRAAAATITWFMLVAGLAITAGVAGALLDPFSFLRLITITAVVSAIAMVMTGIATWRLEPKTPPAFRAEKAEEPQPFREVLREVLREPHTRTFSLFVFVSMLAYSAQDLVLEPFGGAVFGLTPGESTQLGGLQHAGVLIGMVAVGLVGRLVGNERSGSVLRACMFVGCIGAGSLLACLAVAGFKGPPWPLHLNVAVLGFANGAFAVAAIGSMMGLVSVGRERRDGMRMGVFGAAQAIAFGIGGVIGTASIDIGRWLTDSVSTAYAIVFAAQAALFASAALIARHVREPAAGEVESGSQPLAEGRLALAQASQDS
jgi:BCD family chlorophyll transporter-like MFS transporter